MLQCMHGSTPNLQSGLCECVRSRHDLGMIFYIVETRQTADCLYSVLSNSTLYLTMFDVLGPIYPIGHGLDSWVHGLVIGLEAHVLGLCPKGSGYKWTHALLYNSSSVSVWLMTSSVIIHLFSIYIETMKIFKAVAVLCAHRCVHDRRFDISLEDRRDASGNEKHQPTGVHHYQRIHCCLQQKIQQHRCVLDTWVK